MFPDAYQPAMSGAAAYFVHSHPGHSNRGADERPVFQVVPINHSPEEIRAMVRDILG